MDPGILKDFLHCGYRLNCTYGRFCARRVLLFSSLYIMDISFQMQNVLAHVLRAVQHTHITQQVIRATYFAILHALRLTCDSVTWTRYAARTAKSSRANGIIMTDQRTTYLLTERVLVVPAWLTAITPCAYTVPNSATYISTPLNSTHVMVC